MMQDHIDVIVARNFYEASACELLFPQNFVSYYYDDICGKTTLLSRGFVELETARLIPVACPVTVAFPIDCLNLELAPDGMIVWSEDDGSRFIVSDGMLRLIQLRDYVAATREVCAQLSFDWIKK